MNENWEPKRNRGRGRPKGNLAEGKRPLDLETAKFVSLFNSLLANYSKSFIMKYIEEHTGGTASAVVERWLDNRAPISHIAKRHYVCFGRIK
jgi:hypothetical protein